MRKRTILFRLSAEATPPANGLQAIGGEITLEAASSDTAKPRRFVMEAYNGGPMQFGWSEHPVVVDLAGMSISAKPRPIFKDHNPSLIVGHTDKTEIVAGADGTKLRVAGTISGAGAVAREVVQAADAGFPWQASIGADVHKTEAVRAGQQATVNGRTFTGPLLIVRASALKEVSFVALGADDSTAARMAAQHTTTTTNPARKTVMTHRLTLAAFVALTAAYSHLTAELTERAEIVSKEDDEAKKGAADLKAWAESQPPKKVEATDDDAGGADALRASLRAEAAAETRRIAAINKACGKHQEIAAKAIDEGWTVEKAELHVLRAERANPPAFIRGASTDVSTAVLTAAAMQANKLGDAAEKQFKGEVIEAAAKRYRGRISLSEIFIEAARANGYSGRALRVDAEVLRYAFGQVQAAGYSQVDIPGILSNVANKSILEAFMAIEQVWRRISSISPVSDFKQVTRYRLNGDATYEKVGPGGQIKHGKVSEESFTNKADSYAKMLAITRVDLKNDDMGALNAAPRRLGRGAGLTLNQAFWAEWLNDGSFFTSGNKNYVSGGTTALSLTSLAVALQKFRDMKDADSNPLAIQPKLLLVPTALEITAKQLMQSTEIRDTTASKQFGTANVMANMFEVLVSSYLTASATAWYVLGDPADIPAIDTVFLDGQESPTVETAEADFATLGIQMRGFHDFGVAKQDPRAAQKSAGA